MSTALGNTSQDDLEKFNPNIHVGTIYDEKKGRRVPVSDVGLIP